MCGRVPVGFLRPPAGIVTLHGKTAPLTDHLPSKPSTGGST